MKPFQHCLLSNYLETWTYTDGHPLFWNMAKILRYLEENKYQLSQLSAVDNSIVGIDVYINNPKLTTERLLTLLATYPTSVLVLYKFINTEFIQNGYFFYKDKDPNVYICYNNIMQPVTIIPDDSKCDHVMSPINHSSIRTRLTCADFNGVHCVVYEKFCSLDLLLQQTSSVHSHIYHKILMALETLHNDYLYHLNINPTTITFSKDHKGGCRVQFLDLFQCKDGDTYSAPELRFSPGPPCDVYSVGKCLQHLSIDMTLANMMNNLMLTVLPTVRVSAGVALKAFCQYSSV